MADQYTQTANIAVNKVDNTQPAQSTVPAMSNVMTVDQIKTQPQVNIPAPTKPVDNTGGLVSAGQQSMDLLNQALQSSQPTELDKQQQAVLDRLVNLTADSGGREQFKAQQEQQLGASKFQSELSDLSGQIGVQNAEFAKLQNDENNQLISLQGRPITAEAASTEQRAIERRFAILKSSKAAEIGLLSARAQATQGNLQTALQLADRAVTAKYAPIEDEIKVRQAQLNAIQPLLNKQEKQQAIKQQVLLDERTRILNEKKETEKTINDLSLRASSFGAPADVVQAISTANSVVEAINLAGKYTSDPLERILKATQIKKVESEIATDAVQRQSARANIAKQNAEIKKIQAEIANTGAQLEIKAPAGSSQSTIVKLLNSAKSKDNLSATERGSIAKSLSVVDQLDSLQSAIKKTGSGFLGGKLKAFSATIGRNPDAAAVQANLKSLVPQLAKGVYGEVGVLTNTDIENYQKTLPNLTSSEAQNNAVLALTLKTVRNSVKNQLETAAASGVNVSGFVDKYSELTNQINTLEDKIGISKSKVNTLYTNNKELVPLMNDLFKAGATDREVLDALNLNN